MTMDIAPDQVKYIAKQLETHSITFNTLSRDLKLHASQAKRILYAYYSVNKEKLNALYVACGCRGLRMVVKIVDSADEEALREDFDKVSSIHIFSISQNKFTFTSSDIALEELRRPIELDKVEEYYGLGVTRGRALKAALGKVAAPLEPKQSKPKPESRSNATEKSKTPSITEKTELKPKLQYQSRKEKPQASLLSNYVSRKGEKKATDKETGEKRKHPEGTSTYQYKSRKLEKEQPRERVIVSHESEENEEEEEPTKNNVPAKSTNINALFLDDLSDFSDDENKGEKAHEKEEPIMVESGDSRRKDDSEQEAKATKVPLLPEDSSLRSFASKSPSPAALPFAGKEKEEPTTTIDEDGYIVTKKVEAKKEPTKKPPAGIKKPTPSSKKKSDGQKKQASLMSFFDRR